MHSSAVRILLVEDFEPLRNLIRAILEQNPALRIVAEAGDGLEAVQKAADLKPDLILLDVSLPLLNGFDAARLIRKLAPDSKILFVSQDFSASTAKEATNPGAFGCVAKSRAATDLLPAIAAVLLGNTFFSSD
jgi:two-component system nitrate/nitrite response regulator NarL